MINKIRIGFGYDVHPIKKGRKLFLGGVEINSEFGLDGHSDADVLLHAICDALLGALSLGDIGKHFPNTDEKFRNIDSKKLLQRTNQLILDHGYKVANLDSTIVLEMPKLLPVIDEMKKVISSLLNIESNCVSIKATTSEKLGFIGRGEGAEAFCNVLLSKEN